MNEDQEPLKSLLSAIDRLEDATVGPATVKQPRATIETSLHELHFVKTMLRKK